PSTSSGWRKSWSLIFVRRRIPWVRRCWKWRTSMGDDEKKPERSAFWRMRFSLGSLLLLMAVVGLAITLGLTYRKLDRAERELSALQPMSAGEVGRQLQENASLGTYRTTVTDVRYSQKE